MALLSEGPFRLVIVETQRSLTWRSQLQAQSGAVSRQQAESPAWRSAITRRLAVA